MCGIHRRYGQAICGADRSETLFIYNAYQQNHKHPIYGIGSSVDDDKSLIGTLNFREDGNRIEKIPRVL